ncbi:S9 family peptidase [Wenyingzhuangia sp. 2_MG-2023]|uniref:alpha/beta hydrolase family protein n=1 Tax=Wenyingzhuangia sp. 2_MG-2023 TaxID=3062639 RepID=UPI0026E38DD5|nr:alpha/beta fold hydrolase [Wenyingzhuangia sp. 2_MG-2023]MDO6736491.1 alpha/beta hydrolase [Wenyingzhuangia sp. 2_MG-2023]MDO6801202.1 alpha/beta hydrolase [Wenyingzhuangia sp. 1_MG-2023]
MVHKNIQIAGLHQKPILTDIHYTKNNQKKGIVIFCHGYKGYKDWGAWNLMATEFAKQNFFFVKFSFSHSGGTVKQPIDFPDLKAFGQNSYTKELDDLQSVIDFIVNQEEFADQLDTENITLIGHSRGGGVVTLKTGEDSRIKNVVSWAGLSDLEARFPKGFKLWWWKIRGVGYVVNGRTKQKMPHYISFYKDYVQNKERFNIQKTAQNLNANHLLIHGTNDEVVLPVESENVHKWNPKSTLVWIEKMNHSLGCSQPYTEKEMPEDLKKVVQKTIDFIHAQS